MRGIKHIWLVVLFQQWPPWKLGRNKFYINQVRCGNILAPNAVLFPAANNVIVMWEEADRHSMPTYINTIEALWSTVHHVSVTVNEGKSRRLFIWKPNQIKVTWSVTLHHKEMIKWTLITGYLAKQWLKSECQHFSLRPCGLAKDDIRFWGSIWASSVSHCVRPESLTNVRAGLKYTSKWSPRGLKIVTAYQKQCYLKGHILPNL